MAMMPTPPVLMVSPGETISLTGTLVFEPWMWGAEQEGQVPSGTSGLDEIRETWAYSDSGSAPIYYTEIWLGVKLLDTTLHASELTPKMYAGSFSTIIAVKASEVGGNPGNPALLSVHTFVNGVECNADYITAHITQGGEAWTWGVFDATLRDESGNTVAPIQRAWLPDDWIPCSITLEAHMTASDGVVYQARKTVELDEFEMITVPIELGTAPLPTTTAPTPTVTSYPTPTATGTTTAATTTTTATTTSAATTTPVVVVTTLPTGTIPILTNTATTTVTSTVSPNQTQELDDCSWGDCWQRESNQLYIILAILLIIGGAATTYLSTKKVRR